MSKFIHSPDLFLEVQELENIQDFVNSGKGSAKDFLRYLTYTPGIIKSKSDLNFNSFKVEAGTNSKTIKISDSVAVDKNFNLIYKEAQDNISIPDNGSWYWIKIAHQFTNIEQGIVSIDNQGNLIGTNTNFLKVLRGGSDYPVRIKFHNSTNNFETYEVVSVTNNFNAVLSGDFISEPNIRFSVIGAFTDGVVPDPELSQIYSYDSCLNFNTSEALILETVSNTPPTIVEGEEFLIARVKIEGNSVVIEDKREQFWQLKGDYESSFIDKINTNNVLGIESVKWDILNSPKNENQITLAWGIRTSNYTVDSSLRKLTISDGIGGRFKNTSQFQTGDFDVWRVYEKNGNYRNIVNSIKAGSQINLTLDTLNPSDYLTDDEIVIVPSVEEIEFQFEPEETNLNICEQLYKKVIFPIADSYGKVYLKHPNSSGEYKYLVKYRYKNSNKYSEWTIIPDDALGYYTESSYLENGNIKALSQDRTQLPYFDGIITLIAHINNYSTLISTIYKGDSIGVEKITNSFTQNVYDLVVGSFKNYIYINGTIALTTDVVFNLPTAEAQEGNAFSVHFQCDELNLGVYSLKFAQNFGNSGVILKEIKKADIYTMFNKEGGIKLDFKYDGLNWVFTQNYDFGIPNQIITTDGLITELFNTTTKLGKVRGLFGYALCWGGTIDNIVIPDLRERFLVGGTNSEANRIAFKAIAGAKEYQLLLKNIPPHKHVYSRARVANVGTVLDTDIDSGSEKDLRMEPQDTSTVGGENGVAVAFSLMPPYYAVIYAKQLF